eukprot:CAMPEP_0119262176 /NCGR_PEP_ID=MMETSP1329-20130426/1981_1 /TAXON_ID=114041 /ORGANISM="Genus nov. species nov., Strain RCC1024" /LENGTH=92 /DNA_ID=CAMNT_0007261795 /DNA_START=141 /DNA_END=416 /DNA_ORIENTATION=-
MMLRQLARTAHIRTRVGARAFAGDSLHSSDIAYKPADGGWGAAPKYSSNWDNIFGKKDEAAEAAEAPTPAPAPAAPKTSGTAPSAVGGTSYG